MRLLFNKILFLSILMLIGCSKSEDDSSQSGDNTPSITSIEIFVSSGEVVIGTTVIFTAFDNTGKNRTNEVKFFINDSEIPGSSHTFNEEGTYQVYAKLQNFKSQTEEISVNPVPIEYKKYVLVEDFTGTWCGYCTRVSYAIEEVKKQTNDAVIIAIHSGNTSSRYDPFHFSQVGSLMSAFSVGGYPYGLIDRQSRWTPPEPSNISAVTGRLTRKTYAALAMESSLDGDILTIKVKLKMGYNYKALKLGLYILEDGLIYDQENWTTYYSGNPLKNYEHNDVLRKSITGLLGDQIPTDNVGHDKEFVREFQYAIPRQYKKDNIKMVAFVTEASKTETINVRVSKIGETQTFEK